jgi:hypothetical protein
MKQIKDLPDYLISESGDIYSNLTKRQLKKSINKYGYNHIRLFKDGVRKNFQIHRLVASTFIDNPYMKPQVNHKDGNKSNNHVSNLEWVTQSENIRHAINTGLKPIFVHPNAKISCSKKLKDIETNVIYDSISDACRYFNKPFTSFRRYITNNKRFQII